MTVHTDLLHSALRLLIRDQRRVTTIFRAWNANEHVRSHNTLGPIISAAYRRMVRDLDRLYLLSRPHEVSAEFEDSLSEESWSTSLNDSSTGMTEHTTPDTSPELAEVIQRGYRVLDELSARYASVYSLATAVMEAPVANIARANFEGLQGLMTRFNRMVPLATA